VGIGTSPWIKVSQQSALLMQQADVPPVPWFERIVSLAAQKFLIEKGSIASAPFSAAA
jgi:hypothetical protein